MQNTYREELLLACDFRRALPRSWRFAFELITDNDSAPLGARVGSHALIAPIHQVESEFLYENDVLLRRNCVRLHKSRNIVDYLASILLQLRHFWDR